MTEFMPVGRNYPNRKLSVIIRCHKFERLEFLDKALFSLSVQYWRDVEVIVVIQNGTPEFESRIARLIKNHPFSDDAEYKIHSVSVPKNIDGRSRLLNQGIKNSTGRYIAFLDDDDVVYQHGYETLINQLEEGKSAVAVGGCRMAKLINKSGNWYVTTKETPFAWGRNRFDLYKDNFVPIHSYVIDRTRVNINDLYFDETMCLLEDYDFILRLSAKYEFDFSKLNEYVCEYRMHGNNSLPVQSEQKSEISERHLKALEIISERKNNLNCSIPIADLITFLNQEPRTLAESPSISENLRVFKKILEKFESSVYKFFNNYPRAEKHLSKIARLGWTKYSNIKDSKTTD